MPLAIAECPTCKTRTPGQLPMKCPSCGQRMDIRPTQRVRDLDLTTDFQMKVDDPTDLVESLIGSQLGTYHVEQFLGQGGMARVYRARHLTLERPCAVKVLKQSIVERDEDAVRTFLAEARAAANLVHPNVVTIHTLGQDQGRHFIEMEYIDGQSLASLLEAEGCFTPQQATCFMSQIGSALSVAHEHNLVHRDVKPGNVMVDQNRRAKLADFGLARRVHDTASDSGGWLCGTPNFMAPELFRGESADKRSDVYAMGVTYFLLLTGHLPAEGSSITDLMHWHATQTPPDVREIREEIPEVAAQVVARCLARNPADRYDDARELQADLRAAYGSLRSLQGLLEESLRKSPVTMSGEDNRFEIQVQLKDARHQRVVVEVCDSVAVAEQMIRVFSVCGPADPRHYRRALELNPRFPYGALGLEDLRGTSYFVMTNAFPRASCDPDELRHCVIGIAQRADEVERCLTGRDAH